MAVRRKVSFAEAVYAGKITCEDVPARRAGSAAEAFSLARDGIVAVLVDPQAAILDEEPFAALVDARLTKQAPDTTLSAAPLTVGLGPGFVAGENVHAVVETQRGHTLGRVYWQGSASADSRRPEGDPPRVRPGPAQGMLIPDAQMS